MTCIHCGRDRKFHDEKWRFHHYEPIEGHTIKSKALGKKKSSVFNMNHDWGLDV